MKEFKKMIKQGEGSYNIIYLKDTYCLLNKNDKFYYIQENTFTYDADLMDYDYTITLYNKINPYEKRQADYSKGVNNLNDILNYILITKNKKYNNLDNTYNQRIFYDLYTIIENKTILQHLKDIKGYREDYILKNLDRIEEVEDRERYNVLKFIDKEENYFKINTKDIKRLIVG